MYLKRYIVLNESATWVLEYIWDHGQRRDYNEPNIKRGWFYIPVCFDRDLSKEAESCLLKFLWYLTLYNSHISLSLSTYIYMANRYSLAICIWLVEWAKLEDNKANCKAFIKTFFWEVHSIYQNMGSFDAVVIFLVP